MRTLLENLKEDIGAESLRNIKWAGRYVINDLGQAVAEIERLRADNERLRTAHAAINNLQDRSFQPANDLISVAIMIARRALNPDMQ